MSIFLQILINSLIAGAIYSLVSIGFSLIYTTNKFVNFSHGTMVALGGYILFYFFNILGVQFIFAVILSIAITAGLGWLLNILVYEKLRKKKTSSTILLVASIAVMIILESLILIIFGADAKIISFTETNVGLDIFGATITPLQIIIIMVSLIVFFVFLLFIKKTKIGKAIRAVSDNSEVAEIVGISSKNVYSWSFTIGSALAAIAGILIGMEQNLSPNMDAMLVIKGFTGAIIGGIGSIPGAVLGSYLLGIVENFGIWYIPSGYKDAISFFCLFLFLLVLPRGILGIKKHRIYD